MNSKVCLLNLVQAALCDNIITPDELGNVLTTVRSNGGSYDAGTQAFGNGAQPAMAFSKNGQPGAGRHKGTIKSFNPNEGYGFIACPELNKKYGGDVFMHQNQFFACPVPLQQGDNVTFRLEISSKGKP